MTGNKMDIEAERWALLTGACTSTIEEQPADFGFPGSHYYDGAPEWLDDRDSGLPDWADSFDVGHVTCLVADVVMLTPEYVGRRYTPHGWTHVGTYGLGERECYCVESDELRTAECPICEGDGYVGEPYGAEVVFRRWLPCEWARDILSHLERQPETGRMVWAESAPQAYRVAFVDVTGDAVDHDVSQLDAVYRIASAFLELISGGPVNDPDEAIADFANEQPDIYNAARVAWLAESPIGHAEWCHDAIADIGSGVEDLWDLLAGGQRAQAEAVAGAVWEWLVSLSFEGCEEE